MSRCTICNAVMTEQELTHKDPITGNYTELCYDCLDIQEALDNDDEVREVLYVSDTYTDYQDNIDEWS